MNSRVIRACVALVPALLASACASSATRTAASVADYLRPAPLEADAETTGTVLRLPLRLGLAFVPSGRTRPQAGGELAPEISEADRMALLEQVAAPLRSQPSVEHVEVLPSAYLHADGGFHQIDQLQRMFDIDLIVLVSHDQAQYTDQKRSSFTYLTLIGAYFVAGEKNDTRTLLDAAVFDIASRKLLVRAPGVSTVKGSATPVGLSDAKRRDSRQGYGLAQRELSANLEREFFRFLERARADVVPGVRVDTIARRRAVGVT